MYNNKRVIEVVPYNVFWKQQYIYEAKKLESLFKEIFVRAHHIGSTSIPKMMAKPIIDILIEVTDIDEVDKYNKEIEKLGYTPMGEYGISKRRFFLKGIYNRTHHVHIFAEGNSEIERHLNFRDYMISHSECAEKYAKLKAELAIKFKYDIDGYCEGKDKFIKNIDEKAKILKQSKVQ